ncbi:receptor-type tyrosine-protein phosphatase epsilon-like [Halichondria panicea]|uniref:receptor-type tyrosine-protein phosphatase epsilon-like n=1 Tax=Halichondria panicea TaxID=6063 RepID=UPI00312B9608
MVCRIFYRMLGMLLMQLLINSAFTVSAETEMNTTSKISTATTLIAPTETQSPTTTIQTFETRVQTTQSPTSSTTQPTEDPTTDPPTGFDLFWSIPLNRYLIYGGAGGLGLILLFVCFCLIAIARGRSKKSRSFRTYDKSDTHTFTLSIIQPDESINEDLLLCEKIIPITEFTSYVNTLRLNANSGFEEDFDNLATITRKKPPYTVSKMYVNDAKNRFDNVYPFDSSRVILSNVDDDPATDYINASYIDGYDRGNAYIAAQGPLPNTIADFWRMIWELKLTTIIMLTETVESGKEKCQKYWPSTANEPWDVGFSLVVTLTELIPFAEYKVKIMKVENKMDPESCVPLIVTHYHFSVWPDHGVPVDKTSLIHFIQRVRRHHPFFNSSPLLVHCSAGVGRTGTFITLDSMIHMMKTETTLDILPFIRRMRNNRPLMVQTEEQYIFIHEALEEYITCGDTSIAVANLRIAITKLNRLTTDTDDEYITQFDQQFQVLETVSCKLNAINCTEGKKPYNAKKNRYPQRIPYNVCRVAMKPSAVKGSDYINASFIDGYKQQKAFIATQTPLKATVTDFWKMVWENKCRAIVMLSDIQKEEPEEEHCVYWPAEVQESTLYGKLKIKFLSEEVHEDFIIRKLELREDTQYHVPGVVDYLVVNQVQHCNWTLKEVPTTKSVLQIIDSLLKIQRSTGNQAITVCCNDGMGRTGTFITIFSQLERIKTESICDVFQCIKAMRLQRPCMVENAEQLIFCYQTLADYLDTFDRYANFKIK